MKKITSLIIVFSMLVAMLACFDVSTAFAATSGNCGANLGGTNAKWSLNTSTGVLTISGKGATKDCGNVGSNQAPWKDSRDKIKSIVVEEGITALGRYMFYKCEVAESVSLPSTLTAIGDTKFLEYGTFVDCKALTNVTLPSKLQTIGHAAFKGCTSLKSIKIPDSVTTIGTSAFEDCTALSTVTFGTGVKETGNMAFRNSGVSKVKFSSTIAEISPWSFYGCMFVNLEIPETVEKINIRSFANCTALQSVTVNNANCVFDGIGQADASGGKDPFNGSQQSLIVRGHSGSTAQTYAKAKGYTFQSIDDCNHSSTHEVITLEPTCTTAGTTTQVCDNCGFVVSETQLPAKGHSYETVNTENNNGHTYDYQKCSACNDEKTVITHNAFVEGYYDYKTTATCTKAGIETKTCKVEGCNKVEVKAVPSTGHTIEKSTVTKQPTCTQAGEEKGVCSVCNTEVTQTIPALGHTFSDNKETLDNTTTDGHTYLVETCTVCGEKQSTPTHVKWVEGQYTSSVLTKPTCTINGVQIDTCKICGQRRTVSIPANGEHVWQQTSRTEPKCTTNGTIYYKCQNCNATKSETIPALGHNNVVQTEVKPTCTAAGYTIYRCSTCGATTRVENSATGHTPADDSYVITVEPTCTKGGAATATCATCGEAYDIVLDALGHDYVNLDTAIDGHTDHVDRKVICSRCQDLKSENEKYHLEWVDGNYTTETIVAGNCTTSAIYKDTCTFCGATRNRTVEATGAHNYSYSGYDANSAKLTYTCSNCNDVKSYNPTVVLAAWNVNNVNKKAADVTNGYLFELSGDGIINAKDYALIKQAVAKKSSKN